MVKYTVTMLKQDHTYEVHDLGDRATVFQIAQRSADQWRRQVKVTDHRGRVTTFKPSRRGRSAHPSVDH